MKGHRLKKKEACRVFKQEMRDVGGQARRQEETIRPFAGGFTIGACKLRAYAREKHAWQWRGKQALHGPHLIRRL